MGSIEHRNQQVIVAERQSLIILQQQSTMVHRPCHRFALLLSLTALIQLALSVCETPQKGVYFSFRALANKDDLTELFASLLTSSFDLSYIDSDSRVFSVLGLDYELLYNNHFHREEYVDSQTVKVVMGPVTVTCKFNFTIVLNNQTLARGTAFARSHLDYSHFQKRILVSEGYLEWDPIETQALSLSSLWVLEGVSYELSDTYRRTLEGMLNNVVGSNGLKGKIEHEINFYYPQRLKAFLNSEKMLAVTDIPYSYRNLTFSIAHALSSVRVVKSVGVEVFFKFGLSNASKEETECSQLAQFDESSFGGVQEIITFSSLKFILRESLLKGLSSTSLDRSWEVDVFQLFMGDLGNAASFASSFPSTTPLSVSCHSPNPSAASISPFDERSVYLELAESCTVSSNDSQLIKIDMQLITIALLEAQSFFLSVRFGKFQVKGLKFTPIDPRFQVDNLPVARMIVESLLGGLQGKEAFGSKFPLVERRYPSLFLREDSLVVFDHSQLYI